MSDSRADRFKAAVLAGDMASAVEVFSDDVVFNSPVVHRPYTGKAALRAILDAAFSVFEDFRYTAEYSSADGHVLMFRAQVDGRELQGVDILGAASAADEPLPELTVLVRPYSATTALRERMAALLSAGSPSGNS